MMRPEEAGADTASLGLNATSHILYVPSYPSMSPHTLCLPVFYVPSPLTPPPSCLPLHLFLLTPLPPLWRHVWWGLVGWPALQCLTNWLCSQVMYPVEYTDGSRVRWLCIVFSTWLSHCLYSTFQSPPHNHRSTADRIQNLSYLKDWGYNYWTAATCRSKITFAVDHDHDHGHRRYSISIQIGLYNEMKARVVSFIIIIM